MPDEHSSPGSKWVAFEATRWSLIQRARDEKLSEVRRKALQELCSTYWFPLYAFLRSHGNEVHDAQDLTQGFFLSLISGRLLEAAAREKGRFRTLLLAGLKRYAANAKKAHQAWKRGGRVQFIPLDEALSEQKYQASGARRSRPEAAFDCAWAVAVMESALERLRQEYHADGKGPLFDALWPRLTGEVDDTKLAEKADQLKMSEAAVKMALMRLRRLFGHSVRAAVADTVINESEIDDEVRYLLTCFA